MIDGFGSLHAASSASGKRSSSSLSAAGIREVIATTTKSGVYHLICQAK
jgi:hypothetical protein